MPASVSWSLVDSRNASRPLLVTSGRPHVVWSAPSGKLATWLPWRELWQVAD